VLAYLRGVLLEARENAVILDIQGVGYEVHLSRLSLLSLPPIGSEVALKIFTVVREDALLLYGFLTQAEKDSFNLLLKVSKIGPKLAINILSNIDADKLAHIILTADIANLSQVPGVGKKTAERIIVELKGKILPSLQAVSRELPVAKATNRNLSDAVDALLSLGYKRNEVEMALDRIAVSGASRTEEIVRQALKRI
jgi:Holliday junction DNA helicase RuvA